MLKEKNIAIISRNNLVCIGLKNMLSGLFTFESVTTTNNYEEFLKYENNTPFDFIFLTPDIYVVNHYFQAIRNKLVILIEQKENTINQQPALTFLDVTLTESEIADNLNNIFQSKLNSKYVEPHEGLSLRETEVLKLVAIGHINKQIADALSISMHTVISHRKNITRKLGINTVSGLTVYALLNGIIVSSELENI